MIRKSKFVAKTQFHPNMKPSKLGFPILVYN